MISDSKATMSFPMSFEKSRRLYNRGFKWAKSMSLISHQAHTTLIKNQTYIIGRNNKRPLIFRLFYDNALNHFFASANNLYNVKARVKSCIDTC